MPDAWLRTALWRRLARRFAAAVPGQCALCHAWPAQPLCQACCARFAAERPRCRTCACALPQGVAQCGACLRQPPPLDACIAAVDYGYPWADIVTQLKFRGQLGWAAPLARLMQAAPGAAALLAQADVLLPVPLSRERLRQRGYNQAWQLARHLERGPAARLRADVLLRLHDTPAQSGLTRAERLRNLRGAFVPDPLAAPALAGRRIVLIDDVMTTGATLHAAALALRAAGAARVDALVLARTPDRND